MSLTKKIINAPHGDVRSQLILIFGQLKKVVAVYLAASKPKDKVNPNGVGITFSPELSANVDLLATYTLKLSRIVQLAGIDKADKSADPSRIEDTVKEGRILNPNDRE